MVRIAVLCLAAAIFSAPVEAKRKRKPAAVTPPSEVKSGKGMRSPMEYLAELPREALGTQIDKDTPEARRKLVVVDDSTNGFLRLQKNAKCKKDCSHLDLVVFRSKKGQDVVVVSEKFSYDFFQKSGGTWNNVTSFFLENAPLTALAMSEKRSLKLRRNTEAFEDNPFVFELPRKGNVIPILTNPQFTGGRRREAAKLKWNGVGFDYVGPRPKY